MTAALRATLFASLLAAATLVSQKVVYEPLVVPRLASWQEIPWHWWVAIFIPELAICAAVVGLARSITELVLFGLIGALLVESLLWLADLLSQPGHYKTIEGGPVMFMAHYLVVATLLLGIVGALYLLRKGWRYVRAS